MNNIPFHMQEMKKNEEKNRMLLALTRFEIRWVCIMMNNAQLRRNFTLKHIFPFLYFFSCFSIAEWKNNFHFIFRFMLKRTFAFARKIPCNILYFFRMLMHVISYKRALVLFGNWPKWEENRKTLCFRK